MKLVVIHNGLKDRHSHYYNEALGWKRMAQSHGVDLRLYINKDATPQVIADTGGLPAFPFPSDVAFGKLDPVLADLHGMFELGRLFGRSLAAIEPEIAGADAVIVPYASEKEMFGMSLWLSRLPEGSRPRTVFIFHIGSRNWIPDAGVTRGETATWRYAGFRLHTVLPESKISLLATNPMLATALSELMAIPAALCPMPKNYVDETSETEGAHFEPAHLGLIGDYRTEKGSKLVPEVLSGFCTARPDRSVFIQMNSEAQREALCAALPAGAKVTTYVGQFSHADYGRRLRALELLLLPYDARRYWYRFSGVFADALTYGVPVVVPGGTRLAEVLAEGWGAGASFEDYSAASVLRSLIAASDAVPALKQRAQLRSQEWRQRQSIEALFPAIVRFAET